MSNTTVYIIDDGESVRRGFTRLLRSENFVVRTFSSAEEFFDHPYEEENACIISDLMMPGSTGFDVAEELVSRGIKIPLIIVAATDDAPTRKRLRELGTAAFFRKPIDDQALLDAIIWVIIAARRK
jgi:FixJ family two-component response regulator